MSGPYDLTSPDYLSAVARLEEIQRRIYSKLGRGPGDFRDETTFFSNDLVEKMYARSNLEISLEEFKAFARNTYKKAMDTAPTKFEDPQHYSIVLGFVEEIETSIAERKLAPRKHPLFGTVPTGRMNGVAIGIDNPSHYLILLEDGLFGFANLFAKVIAHAMTPIAPDEKGRIGYSTDPAEIGARLKADPVHANRLLDLLFAYAVLGNPLQAKFYLPEQNAMAMSSVLRESMEMFVIAHEYGHCIAGHLDGSARKLFSLPAIETEMIETAWQQEFEADMIGCVLTLDARIRRGLDISQGFAGILTFFGAVEILERFVTVLSTGSQNFEASATHPPPSARKDALLSYLNSAIKGDASEGPKKNLMQFSKQLWDIIELLWQSILPVAERIHREKTAFLPQWSRGN